MEEPTPGKVLESYFGHSLGQPVPEFFRRNKFIFFSEEEYDEYVKESELSKSKPEVPMENRIKELLEFVGRDTENAKNIENTRKLLLGAEAYFEPRYAFKDKMVLVYGNLKKQIEEREQISEEQYQVMIGNAFKSVWPTYKEWKSGYERLNDYPSTISYLKSIHHDEYLKKRSLEMEKDWSTIKKIIYPKVEALYN